jgi:hypothetical protein
MNMGESMKHNRAGVVLKEKIKLEVTERLAK